MKKYLLITALCAVNFAYADGFENLKNLQNQFHVLIYNAGYLGAATPAPEVPYIAGLLTNPVESIGAGEERHIYEFLYDQLSGRTRKAIPGIDQAKVDAFNRVNFNVFQTYNRYQDSGHSVLGVAAQEQLQPIEKAMIIVAVPTAPPLVANSSSSSSNAPTGAGLFAGGGGSFELPKLRKATTKEPSTSVSATAPKSLLEKVREHKETLKNQVDIELLTELENELSRGASEASLASDRYNNLVEFFNLLTTPIPKTVVEQSALEKRISLLRLNLKPSGASVIAAASNDATPENVQIAIDPRRYDNNLLIELLERLKHPNLNNTLYQQYRFEKLKLWFKNKDKPAIAAPQLKLINSIPAFVGEIDVIDVQHAISNLLPANKQQLENLDTELNKQYASAVGDIAKQKKSEIDTNKEKIKQIDKDQELLEELVAGLNGAAVDLLRMQKLKELYMTLIAGKDFVSLLASQRRDLSALVPAEGAKPSGSGRLIIDIMKQRNQAMRKDDSSDDDSDNEEMDIAGIDVNSMNINELRVIKMKLESEHNDAYNSGYSERITEKLKEIQAKINELEPPVLKPAAVVPIVVAKEEVYLTDAELDQVPALTQVKKSLYTGWREGKTKNPQAAREALNFNFPPKYEGEPYGVSPKKVAAPLAGGGGRRGSMGGVALAAPRDFNIEKLPEEADQVLPYLESLASFWPTHIAQRSLSKEAKLAYLDLIEEKLESITQTWINTQLVRVREVPMKISYIRREMKTQKQKIDRM